MSKLFENLPDVIWRKDWPELKKTYGLPLTAQTLANLQSEGRGPTYIKLGRQVGYRREDFIKWFKDNSKLIEPLVWQGQSWGYVLPDIAY